MKVNIKSLVLLAALITGQQTIVNGQQEAMFTQYMFNGLLINPAYAGSHNTLSMSALLRTQWVGLDGAPNTQSFSAHSPVGSSRVSLGLTFLHDKIGIFDQNTILSSYSYRIPLNKTEDLHLYFGLQGGVSHYSMAYSTVSTSDPVYNTGDMSEWYPVVGTGIYLASKRLYVGASIPQLLTAKNIDYEGPLLEQVYHLFVSAGYVFDVTNSLKLKPNILVKAVEGAPVETDLNLNALIKDVLWVGVSWRSMDSFDALFQIQINDRMQFGYSYDFITLTDIRTVSAGSHEFNLNYMLSFNKKRIITPRYF